MTDDRPLPRSGGLRALLLCLVFASLGCRTVSFQPSLQQELALFPELIEMVETLSIRLWNDEPPTEFDAEVMLYYVLEVETPSRSEQHLVRIAPTAERGSWLQGLFSGKKFGKKIVDLDRAVSRGLTREFGAISEAWLAEQADRPILLATLSAASLEERPPYQVFVDTLGPFRADPDRVSKKERDERRARWNRAALLPVFPGFLEPDFVEACFEARRLRRADELERLTPEERDHAFRLIVNAKWKLLYGLLTLATSPALIDILGDVLEEPSLLSLGLASAGSDLGSRAGQVEWAAHALGLRLDESHHSSLSASQGLDWVQFRVDPSVTTTQLLFAEVTATRNRNTPAMSAGLLGLEGTNPYDAEKRFKLTLLGWERQRSRGRRLDVATAFRFSPDGRTFLAKGTEPRLYRIDHPEAGWSTRLRWTPPSVGTWGQDGEFYLCVGELKDSAGYSIDRCHLGTGNVTRAIIVDSEGGRFLADHETSVGPCAVSADGQLFAFETWVDGSHAVVLCEADTGVMLRQFPGTTIHSRGFVASDRLILQDIQDEDRIWVTRAGESDPLGNGAESPRPEMELVAMDLGEIVRSESPESRPVEFVWDRDAKITRVAVPLPNGDERTDEIPIEVDRVVCDPSGRWLLLNGRDARDGIQGSWLWSLED